MIFELNCLRAWGNTHPPEALKPGGKMFILPFIFIWFAFYFRKTHLLFPCAVWLQKLPAQPHGDGRKVCVRRDSED